MYFDLFLDLWPRLTFNKRDKNFFVKLYVVKKFHFSDEKDIHDHPDFSTNERL